MLKKSINLKMAGLHVNCGSCIYHHRLPLFADKPCVEHGVMEYAVAPSCFKPDILGIVEQTPTNFVAQLGRGMADLDPTTLLAVSYLLASSVELKRQTGLQFGQPVYFTLGADYVSHYFKGYPIAFNEIDGTISIAATLNNAKKNTLLKLMPESVLTRTQWFSKLEQLISANRIYLQRSVTDRRVWIAELLSYQGTIKRRATPLQDFNYEPPTLDTAPDVLIARAKQESGKKKTPKKPPRVAGFDLARRASPKDDDVATTVEFTTETGYATQEDD